MIRLSLRQLIHLTIILPPMIGLFYWTVGHQSGFWVGFLATFTRNKVPNTGIAILGSVVALLGCVILFLFFVECNISYFIDSFPSDEEPKSLQAWKSWFNRRN